MKICWWCKKPIFGVYNRHRWTTCCENMRSFALFLVLC